MSVRSSTGSSHTSGIDLMAMLSAAGGAVAIVLTSQRTGVDRKWIALSGAGAGFVIASSATGMMRQIATGVATAGAVIAVMDYLRERQAKPAATPKATPGKEQKVDPSPPSTATRDAAPIDAAAPIAQAVVESNVAAAAPPSTATLTPEQLAHLKAIAESLEPVEREQLSHLENSAPVHLIRRLKATLVGMSVDEAVAFLRANVLTQSRDRRMASGAKPLASSVASEIER